MNTTSPSLLPSAAYVPEHIKSLPVQMLVIPDWWHHEVTVRSPEKELLLQPLVVTPHNDNFLVLDGYTRLAIARSAQRPHIWCIIVPEISDPYEQLLLRIRLNSFREQTFIEKINYVQWCHAHNRQEHTDAIAALLTIDNNELFQIEKCLECIPPITAAVCDGAVALPNVPDLSLLDTQDQGVLLTLFLMFPFSRQTQKELIEWLPELAFREQCSVSSLFAASWIQEIIAHPLLNAPQKIEKIRQTLFDRRFPTIAKTKKTWTKRAVSINPDPAHVVFKPADAFEKNRLEIKITITSSEQAQSIFSALAKIQSTTWDQLIFPAQLYGSDEH